MSWFFDPNYSGNDFVVFGPWHLGFLAGALIFILLVTRLKGASERTRKIFRITFVVVSVTVELSWHIWKAIIGQWTVQEMLPLHLCSIFVILNAVMMLTRNYPIYELAYFLGIAGALQATLTPDAGRYGLPHFRAWQTLIAHTLIMTAPIYMTVVEGYRPTWSSIKRVFIYANLYMAAVTVLNALIGSNYMFTLRKPATASLMDVLGPWPLYLISLEVIGLIMCLILYLPFALRDWRAARRALA